MKNLIPHVLFYLGIFSIGSVSADTIETPSYAVSINDSGKIEYYLNKTKNNNDTISFRNDNYGGIAFQNVILQKQGNQSYRYEAEKDGIVYQLEYKDMNGVLAVDASITNRSEKTFVPKDGIKLYFGLDTYMDKFPRWNDIYFPTMLRCEKTHMTSYFMTPKGNVMLFASPDPIACWENEYECQNMTIKGEKITHGLHRIFTSSFSLLHRLPLPQRHPQDMFALAPGKEKHARFYIKPLNSTENIQMEFHKLTGAPTLSADLYTLPENNEFCGELLIDNMNYVEIRTPRNEVHNLQLTKIKDNAYRWTYKPYSGIGEYTVTAMDKQGKISEMKLYVRPQFDYYLSHARRAALINKPTTTHHAECFYPLYTYFLARKYTPDAAEDKYAEAVYDSIFAVLYDKEAGEMRNGKHRIQDAATMAGVLADRFQVTQNEEDLKNAASLANFLIRCQRKDGGYYNPAHNVHYTSVAYLAKSIMEVMKEEKKLAKHSSEWASSYETHKNSVIKAIDDLARRGDNVQTEGQMTFEDGMISCSATQLALGALKTNDKEKSKWYTKQAILLAEKHKCLTQEIIPDSRMNGATLRFWEYQYTINLMHNGMNSPCGWSAWKYYGSWYLYLLTGEYKYMRNIINGLGSSLQLLNVSTGELRFGFISDPYIDAVQYTETPIGSRKPELNRVILGEQYMNQISNWHYADPYAWRETKFGIDNFNHEVFKCMTEIFMENAYVIEKADGTLMGVNCDLKQNGNVIEVSYSTKLVKNLHVNLSTEHKLKVGNKTYRAKGLKWLIGYPEDLEKF